MVVGACLATITLGTAMPTPPAGKAWQKVDALSDEFTGNSINANKWFDYHPFWTGRAPSKFKRGNAFVRNGFLVLRNTSRIDRMNQVNAPFSDIWIDAAAVVSKEQVAQPGWYYECRMKASDTAMSSSFWFRVGKFSEIDVIEHWGRATSNANVERRTSFEYGCNTHLYGPLAGPPSLGDKWQMPRRGRDGFENYGLWWKSPTDLRFYYNGREVMQVTPRAPFTEKLRMIFDTEALAPNFVGLPTIASLKDNNRNSMSVDWVRTYRLVDAPRPNPGSGSAGLPRVGQRISLQGNNGLYVSSENGTKPMTCNRGSVGPFEIFTVTDAGGGKIGLRGNNNRFVSRENNTPITCNRTQRRGWETFTVRAAGSGKLTLQGSNGFYISRERPTESMTCNRTAARSWETFTWRAQ